MLVQGASTSVPQKDSYRGPGYGGGVHLTSDNQTNGQRNWDTDLNLLFSSSVGTTHWWNPMENIRAISGILLCFPTNAAFIYAIPFFFFLGLHSQLQTVTVAMKLKDDCSLEGIESESRSFMSDSLWPHGVGQNTGVHSLSHLQWIFPTQGLNQVSCIAGGFFTSWTTREVQEYWSG